MPKNEKRGRRHSSTVTVILASPEAEKLVIDRRDVREDTIKGSGAGGQHKNKTMSGIRLTHLPTGVIVTAMEDRRQPINRDMAWRRLTAALEERHNETHRSRASAERCSVFGNGRTWTWCGWRDEVVSPSGSRMSMDRALRGGLEQIID